MTGSLESMTPQRRRRELDRLVHDVCAKIGDLDHYQDLRSKSQKRRFGLWLVPLYGFLMVAALALIRVVLGLVRGNAISTLMIGALAVGFLGAVVVYLVAKMVRSSDEVEAADAEIWLEAAAEVVARLKNEQPESELVKKWSQLK